MRLLLVTIVFVLGSCTPPVVFDQPYPTGVEDLMSIPVAYKGAYICESDSALVLISDFDITLHKSHYFDTQIRQIEERIDCKIIDDKIYVTGREECIPITMINDSTVRGKLKETDTLFMMQEGAVARLYNGHLVISQEMKPDQWAISLLTPETSGDMSYRAITDKTKIDNIQKVTRLNEITTPNDKSARYKVRPTMKEFDALLQDDKVFIECEYLTRVKLDKPFLN